jgi:hypothetical protein
MKKKLLLTAAIAALAVSTQAQVFSSSFATWSGTPSLPTDWMKGGSVSSFNVDSIFKDSLGSATTPYHFKYSCKLMNYDTVYFRMGSTPFTITKGTAYMISYSYRGKGDVRVGLYSGAKLDGGYGYTYSGTISANSGNIWNRQVQSIIGDTNTSVAQIVFGVKETGLTTKNPPAMSGVEIDSVVVTSYMPQTLPIDSIQYTTLATGNSPKFGLCVNTGGIVYAANSTAGYYYVERSNSKQWGGVEVYDFTHSPSVGDSITFSADVNEYYSNTELQTVTNYTRVASTLPSGSWPVPAPIVLNCLSLNNSTGTRPYQGMLAKVKDVTAAASGKYGTPLTDSLETAAPASPFAANTQLYTFTLISASEYSFIEGALYYDGPYNYYIEPRDAGDIGPVVTGIEEYSNALVSKLYPNPVNNELTINLSVTADKAIVTVYDILGKEVSSPLIVAGSQVVLKNITLPSGVYFVKVSIGDQAQMIKFIKE